MTVIVALGACVGYLYIGFRYLPPIYIRRAVEYWGVPEARRNAAQQAAWMALVWPGYFVFLGLAALTRRLGDRLDKAAPLSPVELAARIQERDRRIAELERQLGLQQDDDHG
ncbi:hypothetical protein SAMN04489712_15025 [Thermomonospora echinospora]|uniref:Uncharacterized protein n=1 Tax=Thermomonospora echinospora TaxID=1992 RepID=A0A1H6EAH7_9ACTN|nr:hypothetical protein [Thermomonospora echinospora]SEG94737.1 hypothetical protein SAMN04489712_15025 [Thermomonospora echinospora]